MVKRFDSSEGIVWKYVFEFENAIAEAVLYRYNSFEKRTVICCSVQSGCPVGCKFCGTGNRFIRNLTTEEITSQIDYVVNDMNIKTENVKKFQIMFMSMGEPFLNYLNVQEAILNLNLKYQNADLLISTVGINSKYWGMFSGMSQCVEKVGLQFSIHRAFDDKRDKLIPYKNKLTLREIRDIGIYWSRKTSRPVFLNYCVDGTNIKNSDINRLKDIFSPEFFNFTFSVVCSSNETMKDAGYRNYDVIKNVMTEFVKDGYNVRMFDPAGQDDIGGGCGQLWYVQKFLKEKNIFIKNKSLSEMESNDH